MWKKHIKILKITYIDFTHSQLWLFRIPLLIDASKYTRCSLTLC